MRILISTEALGGGVFEAVRDQVNHRIEAGDEVTLMYARRPETPASTDWPASLRLMEIPWAARPSLNDLSASRLLRREITRGVDLVHLHSSKAGAVGRVAAARTNTPVLYTPHAYAHLRQDLHRTVRSSFRIIERALVPLTDRVLAVSADEYRESVLLGHRTPRLIRNGVPDRGPIYDDRRYVVTVGRITAQRSPEATGRALLEIARRTDREPLWVGTGEDLEVIRRLGVPVTGWLPRHEAISLMKQSAFYIHWSAWDGLSLSLLDAMMAGLPVGASDIRPNREAVGGVVPTFHDVDKMVDWAVELLNSVDGGAATGFALRERALEQFSTAQMLEAIDRAYEEAAESGS